MALELAQTGVHVANHLQSLDVCLWTAVCRSNGNERVCCGVYRHPQFKNILEEMGNIS